MTESSPADGLDGTAGLEVSTDGVDVRVYQRVADGGVPAFEYVVTSNRSESVDVMLTQTLPGSLDPDELGFPTDPADRWTVRDDSWMTYERRLQPGATVRTAWGVRRESHPPLESPEVHVVSAARPSAAARSAATADRSTATADRSTATAGRPPTSAGLPAATDERAAASGDRSTAADWSPAEAWPDGRDRERDPGEPGYDGRAQEDDSVAAALVEELRTGSVPVREREALRDALGVDGAASPEAVVEQIQDLQRHHNQLVEAIETLEARVANVRSAAPTTTEINQLKRGLAQLYDATVERGESEADEAAGASGAVEDVREELDALRREVEDLESRVAEVGDDGEVGAGSAAGAVDGVHHGVDDLRERVDALDERSVGPEAIRDLRGALSQLEHDAATEAAVSALGEELAALEAAAATEAELEDVRDRLGDLADGLDAVETSAAAESDLDELQETVAALADAQNELSETVAAIEGIEESIASLEGRAVADELERLEDRIAALAARAASADALGELNERLKQVEQGVLGFGTLVERIESLESETEARLEAHEDALEELRRADALTGGDVRRHVNETRSDVARIEDRLDAEFASEADLESAVDERVRSSLAGHLLLGAGAVALVAAVPVAALAPVAGLATGAGGAVALAVRRVAL